MKILLDTIDLKIIKRFNETGLLFGITTNPTLAKRFGMSDDIDMVKKIRHVMPVGEIHVEAFGKTSPEIVENAKRIHRCTEDTNLVFKVPFNVEGVKAVNTLKNELGYKTNLHLIFSANQALISSCVNSDYICPLVGRLDDVGHDAFENLEKIIASFHKFGYNKTKVMVSSVRHTQHVQRAFMVGADVVTIPPAVLDKMFGHPLTDAGYLAFEEDIKMMQIIQDEDIDRHNLVHHDTLLKDCISHMTDTKTNIVVTNFEGNVGVYTMGDFKRLLVREDYAIQNFLEKQIKDFANFDATTIESRSSYADAKKAFENTEIGHLVVIENNLAVGGLDKRCLHE
tara:strand:- start:215 stop:1234 length:1020 start_codon:yes stop_codon:yes gene_type:complete